MNTNENATRSNAPADELQQSADQLLDHAEGMIWALLDDSLEDQQLDQLQQLIVENEAIRTRYLECVQLHTDLFGHFQASSPSGKQSEDPNAVIRQIISEHLPNLTTLPHVQD